MKRAGKERLAWARLMVMCPSSMGPRRVSSTFFLNSGSSSRKSTPFWAREASPGRGMAPPPTIPASLMVWCGARKGRSVTRERPAPSFPSTLHTWLVSIASLRVSRGSKNFHIPDVGEHGGRVVFAAPNDEVGLAGQGATLHEAQGRGAEVHDAYASAVEDGGKVAGG